MTHREAQEIKEGLSSPFGRWLLSYLKKQAQETKDSAVESIPQNFFENIEREQNFGRAKQLSELVSQIPHTIDQLIADTKHE